MTSNDWALSCKIMIVTIEPAHKEELEVVNGVLGVTGERVSL